MLIGREGGNSLCLGESTTPVQAVSGLRLGFLLTAIQPMAACLRANLSLWPPCLDGWSTTLLKTVHWELFEAGP